MKNDSLIYERSVQLINKAWNWKGINVVSILESNYFGNIIFIDEKEKIYRICPEELTMKKIAESKEDFDILKNYEDFKEDWEMVNLVEMARKELGELSILEKYCLKIPAVLGGEYSNDNLGKIKYDEQILVSGDLAYQIKDLKDGQKITLKTKLMK